METPIDYRLHHNPHNLVTYVEPLRDVPRTMAELIMSPQEKCLAENAIYFFLDNPAWEMRDKLSLDNMWKKHGWNMFVWKHYRAARAYVGGYKALSAHLMLARIR